MDTKNVAWLENYLTGLTDVTSIMVSHDSGFLDRVCTHILNYEGRKLKCYRGNLSEFVKQYPAAKSYYELTNANVAFKFPEPVRSHVHAWGNLCGLSHVHAWGRMCGLSHVHAWGSLCG